MLVFFNLEKSSIALSNIESNARSFGLENLGAFSAALSPLHTKLILIYFSLIKIAQALTYW
jgi:hypothetical protein